MSIRGDGEGLASDSPDSAALESAASHLSRGAFKAALQSASEACHDAPCDARAHYIYGQCWLALGEPARAEQAFAAALQLDPGWADAWVNHGVARYRQGDVEAAKLAMREALLRSPGHAAATANLGAFLRLTGQSEAGEALLRRSVESDPGAAGPRLNLVADLLQSERAQEALALLDAATRPADERAARHWALQRARALLQLGRVAEGRAELERFAALGPCPPEFQILWRWRQVLLEAAEGKRERACEEAEGAEAALEAVGAHAAPEHRIMAHFDLAKFWSGLGGEPRRAFRHWTLGHAALKPQQPFSRANHSAFVDASHAAFDGARLAGPRASNRDPAPVFIVGMPRSGTTLCEQILAAHGEAHGAGERLALPRLVAALGGGGDGPEGVRRLAGLGPAALDEAASAYLADLHALAPGKARIVDKMPGNFAYLGFIATLLPGAKIIFCTRDPRDIGLSIFTYRFHGHHPYAHDLGDLGFAIGEHLRLMDHWRAVLPQTILTVRLSDWVEDFDATLARVLDHVGLPFDPACARFHEADHHVRTVSYAQVRQPVNARGLGRWRAFADELAPLTAELAAAGRLPPENLIAEDRRPRSAP